MLFKRLNRDNPEQIFIVVQNNEGSAMVANQAVQLDVTTAIDGVKARQPDTGALWAFLGLADAAIADQDYGLVQVYGYRSTSVIFQTNTSQASGAGLVPVAGQNYLASVATATASNSAVTQQPIFAVLGETIVDSSASATASAKVFLRAL